MLPLYTISRELFERIGRDNGLTEEENSEIWHQIVERKEQLETILTANDVIDEIPDLSAEKDKKPLSLTGIFYRKELFYSAEQYREHFKQTQEYAREHENYTVKIIEEPSFRQIDVALHEGKWAMISKKTTPNIHFVIREKKLLRAIEGYQVPVAEE